MPKVSIIVPVYKAEAYLHRCVDSILAQTFTDWELLLIDDGSPDKSGEICDEYTKKDSRIRVIHKKNSGVAAARQDGLELSQGEYIIHADSDDWMEPQTLLELYTVAQHEKADVVLCDYYIVNGDFKTYVKQKPTQISNNDRIIKDFTRNLLGSLWNKLVRRECILKYNVHFIPEINYSEDLLFCYQLFVNPVKTVYLGKAFYNYVMQDSSITHNLSRKNINARLKAYEQMKIILCKPCFSEDLQAFKFDIVIDAIKSGLYNVKEIANMYADCKLLIGLKFGVGKKQKLFALLMYLGQICRAVQLFN